MAKSMTGYGRGDCESNGRQFTVEIKSVNHRFLEVNVRIPRAYIALEEKIRRTVSEYLSRGKVDIFVQSKVYGEKKHQLNVDKDLAIVYYNSVKELDALLGISSSVDSFRLLNLPGVLETEEPVEEMEEVWETLSQGVKTALSGLTLMRVNEGAKLKTDVISRLSEIKNIVERILERAPLVADNYRNRLNERLAESLGDISVDEARLIQEVAFFADRANVDEELVRLNSHISQLSQLIAEEVPVGRKIDFLIQEMNREANTIGSKANDLDVSRLVVELKAEIEKIREQVQNLE